MRLPRNARSRIAEVVKDMPIMAGNIFGYVDDQQMKLLSDWLLQINELNDLLDEGDLTSIIVRQCRPYANAAPVDFQGTIEQLPGINVDELVEHIVVFLESLPRKYFVFFEIPKFQKYGIPEIQLSNQLAIVETTDSFDNRYLRPIEETNNDAQLLRRYKTYIRIAVEGFGNQSLVSACVAKAIGQLKHFVYLGTAFSVLREKGLSDLIAEMYIDQSDVMTRQRVHAVICNADNPQEESYDLRLPFEVSDQLAWMQALETDLNVFGEIGNATSLLSGRPAVTPEEKVEAIKLNFLSAATLLNIPSDIEDAKTLKTAIEWLFDSNVDKNNTFSFLQACIGLEALLGDDKKDRVTEKLADRYSYLLGQTASDRKKYRDQFLKIYDHRSNIMHGRRAKLKGGDYKAMSSARTMLDQCIRVEIRGLLKSIRQGS
ncbi:hypothetical protein D3C87_122120 [compost metagenome]